MSVQYSFVLSETINFFELNWIEIELNWIEILEIGTFSAVLVTALRPNDTYIHHWRRSDDKPLSESMMAYFWYDL